MSNVADSHEYTPAGNRRCIAFCKKNNGCHPDTCPQNKNWANGCSAKSRHLLWKGISENFKKISNTTTSSEKGA